MPMLLVQIDPNFVSLNLYENNQLTFSRFASIDAVDYDNSEDYIYEAVTENISRMFQFQRSRNPEDPIKNVVFYGDTTEYIRLTNALESLDITTSLLGVPNNVGGYENFEFQAYANAIGAMLRSNKDSERINLIETDATSGRSAAGASFVATVVVAAIASIALVAGITLGANVVKSQYEDDTATIQAWLDSPETAQKTAAVDTAQAKLDKVNSFRGSLEEAKGYFDSLPVFTTEVKTTLEENFKGTDAKILSYTFANGEITLQCRADDNQTPAKVVTNFVEQDAFSNITYTGYSSSSDKDSVKEVYDFTIFVQIKEVVPEETTEEAE